MSAHRRSWRGFLAAVFVFVLALAGAPAARAVSGATLSPPDQADPVVGETVTFTMDAAGLSTPPHSVTYFLNDADFAESGYDSVTLGPSDPSQQLLSASFDTPGVYHLQGVVSDQVGSNQPTNSSTVIRTVTVHPVLSGSITPVGGTPKLGSQITLSASAAGGKAGYAYLWDLDGDGFDDGAGATITPTIATGTPGPRTFRVQVRDGASPAHTVIVSTAVTFAAADPAPTPTATATSTPAPEKPAPGKATPTPTPACTTRLAWAIYEIGTSGCFTPDPKNSKRFTTTSPVFVNGLRFTPSAKSPFEVIVGDAKTDGSILLADASIAALNTTFFSGKLALTLPKGKAAGSEAETGSLSVRAGAAVYGFGATGDMPVILGLNAAGRYYVKLSVALKLPDVFKSGPEKSSPGLTSRIVLEIDKTGTVTQGFKIEAKNAWLGKLKVENICFAYAAANSTAVTPCAAPNLDGKPYLTCGQDPTQARWSGNAVVVLPTGSSPRVAAFGSVSGGQISSLGGFADNLGTSVPITNGVYLNRVGIGLCINPPPFKLRGDVGVSVLPINGKPTVAVNGYFLYTDANGATPWSLELGGTVYVLGNQVGSGSLLIKGNGAIDFNLKVGFSFSIISIEGGVNGWIEPAIKKFLVQGYLKGCIGVICARADGLVSNLGLAACVDLGEIKWWTLEKDADWVWWAWWRLHWVEHVTKLKGGFGYTWSPSSLSLLGSSCDFGPWTPKRNAFAASFGRFDLLGLPTGLEASRAAQAAANTITVAKGTRAVALKVKGNGAAPKIKATGPDGSVAASDPATPSAQTPGKWMIAENPTDTSTSVMLINPAAGNWTFEALPGSAAITTIETSPYEGTPQVIGGVGNAPGGKKVLNVGFDLPDGATLSLQETGDDTSQVLDDDVKPRACEERVKASPVGGSVKCASITFSPAPGKGGKREIHATITRGGVEISRQVIATYQAPSWAKPAKPSRIGITRKAGIVTVSWAAARGADRYAVSVTAADGTSTGFDVAGRCRAVRITGVPSDASVKATVTGVRADQETGRRAIAKLGAKKSATAKRVPKVRPRCS
ncbi:MAG: hypothetical protein J7513_03845 [Solirubrobacteraceae bacterium]|nr:hypothetical protein [Solirubrobacteraceae bacterium]